jgi:hypothetical protein
MFGVVERAVDGNRVDGELMAKSPRIDAVQSEMAELAGVINAAQGRLVGLIAQGLDEGLWQQSGVHSPVQWLTWQLGISAGHAGRLLSLAKRAGELPETMAAFQSGEVSLEQAAVVARRVPADHEASAASLARAAKEAGIAVFPGAELETKEGAHVLCLFDPTTPATKVSGILGDCG